MKTPKYDIVNLSKRDRKYIYKLLLKAVCEDSDICYGFCKYLRDVLTTLGIEWSVSYFAVFCNMDTYFPELYSLRPKHIRRSSYWYPRTSKGWQTRIDKLYDLINSM